MRTLSLGEGDCLINTAVKNGRTWLIQGVSNAFGIHSIICKWQVAFVNEEVPYLVDY